MIVRVLILFLLAQSVTSASAQRTFWPKTGEAWDVFGCEDPDQRAEADLHACDIVPFDETDARENPVEVYGWRLDGRTQSVLAAHIMVYKRDGIWRVNAYRTVVSEPWEDGVDDMMTTMSVVMDRDISEIEAGRFINVINASVIYREPSPSERITICGGKSLNVFSYDGALASIARQTGCPRRDKVDETVEKLNTVFAAIAPEFGGFGDDLTRAPELQ